ncbi:hypothetical protein C8Q79DRAFT_645335 [Trametes meyenii]|nr:hypothetical protein C8Q79DRAFT_645335 [Trametes meyenii]
MRKYLFAVQSAVQVIWPTSRYSMTYGEIEHVSPPGNAERSPVGEGQQRPEQLSCRGCYGRVSSLYPRADGCPRSSLTKIRTPAHSTPSGAIAVSTRQRPTDSAQPSRRRFFYASSTRTANLRPQRPTASSTSRYLRGGSNSRPGHRERGRIRDHRASPTAARRGTPACDSDRTLYSQGGGPRADMGGPRESCRVQMRPCGASCT